MKYLLRSVALILALTGPAYAVNDWDEGFEYANNDAMDSVWSSSCPGNDVILFPSTDRFHSGSKALKEIFRGHQAIGGQPATPGYQSCYKDRNLAAPTTGTLYTRFWMYMENFTVDATTTKITLHPAYASDSYSSVWWGMFWGSPTLSGTIQRSDGTSEILYGDAIPQNQWVCIQTRMTYATPGQNNGVMQAWINGGMAINQSTVRMDQAGQQSVFRAVRLYVQDGMGTIYYDDYAVSRDALPACNPGSPGGGGGPLPDTSAPNAPTDLRVTELWNDFKYLLASVWSWLGPASAEAATAASDQVVIRWEPRPGQRFTLDLTGFAWTGAKTFAGLDAGLGLLTVPLPGLPPGQPGDDRWLCAKERDGKALTGCNQLALGPIVLPPPPVPDPIPEPEPEPELIGPAIVTMSGDKVFIACDPARYTKADTTGRGTKRVITCLK